MVVLSSCNGECYCYGIHLWYGNLTVQLKTKLTHLIRIAMKIVGMKEHSNLQTLYEKSVLREAYEILNCTVHILNREFEMLQLGRRFIMPRCRLSRFKNAFIPSATKALNSSL